MNRLHNYTDAKRRYVFCHFLKAFICIVVLVNAKIYVFFCIRVYLTFLFFFIIFYYRRATASPDYFTDMKIVSFLSPFFPSHNISNRLKLNVFEHKLAQRIVYNPYDYTISIRGYDRRGHNIFLIIFFSPHPIDFKFYQSSSSPPTPENLSRDV